MKKNKILISYLFWITMVLILVGITLRSVSLLEFYDSEIGYFKSDAHLPDVFHGISVAEVIGAVLISLFLSKANAETGIEYRYPSNSSLFVRIAACFPLFAVVMHVSCTFLEMMKDKYKYNISTSSAGAYIDLFMLLFGIMGAVYFLMFIVGKVSYKKEASVYLGYGFIIYVLLMLARTYFDFETTMNSPTKLFIQVTLMSVMVYMLYETRFYIKRESPRVYCAVSAVAAYFTAACSIPGIALYFVGGVFKAPEYLMINFVCFGVFLFILSRFYSFTRENG